MGNNRLRPYDSLPCYPAALGQVRQGWDVLVASIPARAVVLAVDGPVLAAWPQLIEGLGAALGRCARGTHFFGSWQWFAPWEKVAAATSSYELRDDPDFEYLASGQLADLLAHRSRPQVADGDLGVVYGPGAALIPHDVLWYADLPKRYAEATVAADRGLNLGQPPSASGATTKRLFYIDWPILDRHRDQIAGDIEQWVDMRQPAAPASVDGPALRATLAGLAARPFRTRPTFNSTPWGGHWAQEKLGHNPDGPNTALGYELIAPEAGVLIGTSGGPQVEVPFQLVVSTHPVAMLGRQVHEAFGTSFPVRFDYLDTVGGGNLSVHCHPREDYMRTVFGWPYTQHESYYVMVGGRDNEVFLGLRQDADVALFEREAHLANNEGAPLEVPHYVASFRAEEHRLFLIPGGTPHGSGRGNVVLEISATPYLYSLRFYDWLRRDSSGSFRPVHVEHAFRNLNRDRRGLEVERELCQPPRTLRQGRGWKEELLGSLAEMFFEVRRLALQPGAVAAERTNGRFHVLNVVQGRGATIECGDGNVHSLVYAETIVVPASVGTYRLSAMGNEPVRVVKALVR